MHCPLCYTVLGKSTSPELPMLQSRFSVVTKSYALSSGPSYCFSEYRRDLSDLSHLCVQAITLAHSPRFSKAERPTDLHREVLFHLLQPPLRLPLLLETFSLRCYAADPIPHVSIRPVAIAYCRLVSDIDPVRNCTVPALQALGQAPRETDCSSYT